MEEANNRHLIFFYSLFFSSSSVIASPLKHYGKVNHISLFRHSLDFLVDLFLEQALTWVTCFSLINDIMAFETDYASIIGTLISDNIRFVLKNSASRISCVFSFQNCFVFSEGIWNWLVSEAKWVINKRDRLTNFQLIESIFFQQSFVGCFIFFWGGGGGAFKRTTSHKRQSF